MSPRIPVALLALATPAAGSLLEAASGGAVSYQFDGDTHHDAPDACADADAAWKVAAGGAADGLLVPPDDASDVFLVDVPDALVGQRLGLSVLPAEGMPDLAVDAYAPDCAGSVLDAVNWPTPEPSPPAPASGQAQHSADVSAPLHCDGRQWVFALDGMEGLAAPASIHVAWTDGSEQAVPLHGRYGRHDEYAVYASGDRLGVLLKGAWANLGQAWGGAFHLAIGPCDARDGGAVYGAPPTLDDGALSFTPVRPGPHAVQVSFKAGAPEPRLGPGTKSCHYCLDEVEDVGSKFSYRLRVGT